MAPVSAPQIRSTMTAFIYPSCLLVLYFVPSSKRLSESLTKSAVSKLPETAFNGRHGAACRTVKFEEIHCTHPYRV